MCTQPFNQNLVRITELLNDGNYHDIALIGKQLNMAPPAVWKIIQTLQHHAVPMIFTKGKGYRLDMPLNLLDYDKMTAQLCHLPSQLTIFTTIDSTNEYLKTFMHANNKVRVCIAETQTQGKGRLNRHWHSPFGQNVYFSMLYPFAQTISELAGLSLVVGLAVCRTIENVIAIGNNTLTVKWPNDVFGNGEKLAGILLEVHVESHGFCQVIIGIGINVNMNTADRKNIGQPWTSLLKMTQQYQDRNKLCVTLIDVLSNYLEKFSVDGLAHFITEWQSKDHLVGNTITLVTNNKRHTAICVGIDRRGQLLLKTATQSIQAYSSGNATILKQDN